jgi:hypothetical protein
MLGIKSSRRIHTIRFAKYTIYTLFNNSIVCLFIVVFFTWARISDILLIIIKRINTKYTDKTIIFKLLNFIIMFKLNQYLKFG